MQVTPREDGDEPAAMSSRTVAQHVSPAADPDRRRLQLITAQRAYCERQQERLLKLRRKIGDLEEINTTLHAHNEQLQLVIAELAVENSTVFATSLRKNISTTEKRCIG
ncbi:hypothetical protein ETB97_011840 [Aspergillus alliaceus]|uniref:Uncharacterized protein n=1 Tax=Petromyces alliaceus TaxID=209559 RepID=A0A8H6A5R0_PETAA|nr:hypothetical protein ETB97_011840 [Aspergillus burnettii]